MGTGPGDSLDTGSGVCAFAPAKINLALHVTGQRPDGYHLLDSLVVFADVGDRVCVTPADETVLQVVGPRAPGVPRDASNLVLRAADWLGAPPAAISLEKHLPMAAGLGGGSSDAAATLRALAGAFALEVPSPKSVVGLGADVPVCLKAVPCRMSGIGEVIEQVADLPALHMVLVNPGVEISTPAVFSALSGRDGDPMPDDLPEWRDAAELAGWLKRQRNDLELPARTIAPAIGVALMRLAQIGGCLLARMSGSGASCFGLYASRPEADAAAEAITALYPDWWCVAASSPASAPGAAQNFSKNFSKNF